VKRRVANIPLITLIGSITFGYLLWMIYASYAYPAVGGYITPYTIATFLSVAILGVVVYFVSKWYRAKQGIDLSVIYSEIPPE
jgi:hypothetical protein